MNKVDKIRSILDLIEQAQSKMQYLRERGKGLQKIVGQNLSWWEMPMEFLFETSPRQALTKVAKSLRATDLAIKRLKKRAHELLSQL